MLMVHANGSSYFICLIENTLANFEHHLSMTSHVSHLLDAFPHTPFYPLLDVLISFERNNCPGRRLNMEAFQLGDVSGFRQTTPRRDLSTKIY